MQKNDETFWSIFLIFLRFGFLAWGGPVAQISMIHEELVERRQWISPDKFKRALAVYQALPGPEAHELCVYMGMNRKGRIGGLLAGLGFMLPGFSLVLLVAWTYTLFGMQTLLPLFAGVAPAVTAMIVRAAHRIGQHTLTEQSLWVAAAVSVALTLTGSHFVWIFITCAVWQSLWARGLEKAAVAALTALCIVSAGLSFVMPPGDFQILENSGLFIEGLKAGLLSFGGAYTAIPFLRSSMVDIYPAITPQAFLDSIALSNIIPAPLVIFGTFLGYLTDGLFGALLITLGIFIPAFSFTLIGHGYIEKAIKNPSLHGALDGMAAAVVGLLALTAIDIAVQTLNGLPAIALFTTALAGFYVLRGGWAAPAIIIGCGFAGFLLPI